MVNYYISAGSETIRCYKRGSWASQSAW